MIHPWPRVGGVLFLGLVVLLGACSSEGGGGGGGAGCPFDLRVAINQGVDFGACRVLSSETDPKVSSATVDLLVYKNQGGFDFWSGDKDGATQPLRIIREGGGSGPPATFKSLDEVPFRKPIPSRTEDAQGRFFDVGTGNGLVVRNAVGEGYTKVWVKQAITAAQLVEIQWTTY